MSEPHFDEIAADPAAYFKSPADVLTAEDLSAHMKLKVLESWKLDAERMAESENENMAGGERSRLAEVHRAILKLQSGTIAKT